MTLKPGSAFLTLRMSSLCARLHLVYISRGDSVFMAFLCSGPGGKAVVWAGLLWGIPGGHHWRRHCGLHGQDAERCVDRGARRRTGGALPWHLRSSAAQHSHCSAGEGHYCGHSHEVPCSYMHEGFGRRGYCKTNIIYVIYRVTYHNKTANVQR